MRVSKRKPRKFPPFIPERKWEREAEKTHRSSEREGNLHSVAFIQNLPFSYFSQEE
jgi:hypothetical protein